jgi:hypothetical protein
VTIAAAVASFQWVIGFPGIGDQCPEWALTMTGIHTLLMPTKDYTSIARVNVLARR